MSEEIKLKNGEFYGIFWKNRGDIGIFELDKVFKKRLKGKIFTYKGIEFGISGNSKEGYRLNHIKSGMLVNNRTYKKLNDFKEDIELIYKIINKFNSEQLKEIENLLNKCEEGE